MTSSCSCSGAHAGGGWGTAVSGRWGRRTGVVAVEDGDAGAAGGGRGAGEFAAGQDDGDGDEGAVELGFVHVRDGGFGGGGGRVEDVGCAAVGHDCGGWRGWLLVGGLGFGEER